PGAAGAAAGGPARGPGAGGPGARGAGGPPRGTGAGPGAGPGPGGGRAGGPGGAAAGPQAVRAFDWLHINSATYVGPNKWFDAGDKRFAPENVIICSRQASFIAIIARDGKVVWR